MNRNKYYTKARELYDTNQISGEVYDAMIMNADEFCDDDSETNYLMLTKLLDVYKPKRRGIVSVEERVLVSETLHLKERSAIDLRNLRDFVVASMSHDDDMETWDKMSAITHIIDVELVERGEEV